MRKYLFLAVTAAMLLWPTDTGAAAAAYKGDVPPFCASSVQETKEELYRQLFITLLFPHVEKAIRDYYDEYMKYLPGEAPWAYDFTRFEKTPNKNYEYTVTMEVRPYVGPHLSVGKDRMTFEIGLGGVALQKYEHLESHELPSHYQDIWIKPLPTP